jgi:formate hydrogenlyase subunit 3/multisubunit Na+/H+ antiporter MnhD subunit
MKILKLVLVIVGVVLIVVGLYNAFMPQDVLSIGAFKVSSEEGLMNQTLGMIGLGVLALLAAISAKNRR